MRNAAGSTGNACLPRVIAVTSGKGGVGKTNIVANAAVSLSRMGKRVIIIDADVGLANIDIIFNLRPEFNIRHVISSEKTLKEVMVQSKHGVRILPGGSGFSDLTRLGEGEKLNLLTEFETLSDQADIIFVDTGAGISSNVLYFNSACDECVVIATSEPTSITDAYAMMKVMSREYGTMYFKLIVNMVDSEADAKRVYASLSGALDKFLKNVVLEYVGYIPFDRQLQQAVQKRGLVLDNFPDSVSAQAINEIAAILGKRPIKNNSNGNLTFFMSKVFQTTT
ncbi:MAG: flagellar synthesis regulator FleN [Desulfobacterales bacterium RIFOXYA12_FULL_46_15]|nr:MAG: flagellar synthesis regulator FleN [Desulfobacula sp. GWF2_41_7]OGR27064.1 MAG: flagellar synthesis regulator FleN [Desulfobacterales bacterium RIFOXYA12_FULL_46_15]